MTKREKFQNGLKPHVFRGFRQKKPGSKARLYTFRFCLSIRRHRKANGLLDLP